MHAGVLPGYPASHGCIRMPMAFAVKMWNWTRMGARVVVTPGEITPASFSHPLLVTQKVVPQPRRRAAGGCAARPEIRQGVRGRPADRARDFGSEARIEIDRRPRRRRKVRSSANRRPTSLRDQTHTADASGGRAATKPTITIADAASSGGNATPPAESKPDSAPVAADAPKPDAISGWVRCPPGATAPSRSGSGSVRSEAGCSCCR